MGDCLGALGQGFQGVSLEPWSDLGGVSVKVLYL